MPKATATVEAIRKDLVTCPPDGFVMLRQLTYGEYLKRRDMAQRMEAVQGEDGRSPTGMQVVVNSAAVAMYEFGNLIIDHNLEDENGKKLNFNDHQDVVKLDPRIASEIEKYITDMNEFEASPMGTENGKKVPFSSTSEEPSSQPTAASQ